MVCAEFHFTIIAICIIQFNSFKTVSDHLVRPSCHPLHPICSHHVLFVSSSKLLDCCVRRRLSFPRSPLCLWRPGLFSRRCPQHLLCLPHLHSFPESVSLMNSSISQVFSVTSLSWWQWRKKAHFQLLSSHIIMSVTYN